MQHAIEIGNSAILKSFVTQMSLEHSNSSSDVLPPIALSPVSALESLLHCYWFMFSHRVTLLSDGFRLQGAQH